MEAVGQLTGGVARDFNNILAATISNLELVIPQLSTPDQRELVGEAQGAAHDGAELRGATAGFRTKTAPQYPESTDVGALLTSFSALLRGRSVKISTFGLMSRQNRGWP